MIEVSPNLFVGTDRNCNFGNANDWAIIHACKSPCHTTFVGYKGSLSSIHPNYLIAEDKNNLVLNMVDMEKELLPKFTNPIMEASIHFIEKHIQDKKVLVHCNQGMSRSPSIALVYLARKNKIINASFEEAYFDFTNLYPNYQPGKGIHKYLSKNWRFLLEGF